MRTILATIVLAALVVLAPSPASAAAWSGDSRIGAYLTSTRSCGGGLTMYQLNLRNDTGAARTFRTTEVRSSAKVGDHYWRVPAHETTGVMFYVPSGVSERVTALYAGEVLTSRAISGICY